MSTKLHQLIAIEKGVKSRVYGEVTSLHKDSQKPEPYNGLVRTFVKKDEEGEDFPPERKKVTLRAEDVLRRLSTLTSELFDVEASKDRANCEAKADLVVGGVSIMKDAPATFLIFLDKQLSDLRTFVDKLPTLDESEDWTLDTSTGMYRSTETVTGKTKKSQRPIVLFPATPEHPAQTQMITDDILVGHWHTVRQSGAIPATRKATILDRIDSLIKAAKQAREQANAVETKDQAVGAAVFGYLFKT